MSCVGWRVTMLSVVYQNVSFCWCGKLVSFVCCIYSSKLIWFCCVPCLFGFSTPNCRKSGDTGLSWCTNLGITDMSIDFWWVSLRPHTPAHALRQSVECDWRLDQSVAFPRQMLKPRWLRDLWGDYLATASSLSWFWTEFVSKQKEWPNK